MIEDRRQQEFAKAERLFLGADDLAVPTDAV